MESSAQHTGDYSFVPRGQGQRSLPFCLMPLTSRPKCWAICQLPFTNLKTSLDVGMSVPSHSLLFPAPLHHTPAHSPPSLTHPMSQAEVFSTEVPWGGGADGRRIPPSFHLCPASHQQGLPPSHLPTAPSAGVPAAHEETPNFKKYVWVSISVGNFVDSGKLCTLWLPALCNYIFRFP